MLAVIRTLQEFMFQTKGIIYLLILAYLIGFPLFWRFLNRNDKDR
jgi:hypothetical protein